MNKTMKVKIMQRSVFYKYAEIEIKVPQDTDIEQFLLDNEEVWSNKIDNAMSKAKYKTGKGMQSYEWTNKEEDSEIMYLSTSIGGHL
tara:strand:- start:332 stop:592 length:261 start_codon:yes stop_codon:yes gene_type:complete